MATGAALSAAKKSVPHSSEGVRGGVSCEGVKQHTRSEEVSRQFAE